jgi:hypothetical protein
MNERTIGRIISAVVGLALIGAGVYLAVIDRREHVSTLITIGIAALGVAGVVLPSPLGQRDEKPAKPKKPPKPPGPPAMLALLLLLLVGCGATAQQRQTQHDVLDRVTDVADPTYAIVLGSCDAARNVIVNRPGTTFDEDTRALNEIDDVCDGIVEGMETLRGTQLTARAAITAGAQGAILEGLQAALRLWATLQAKIPELQTLGRGGES